MFNRHIVNLVNIRGRLIHYSDSYERDQCHYIKVHIQTEFERSKLAEKKIHHKQESNNVSTSQVTEHKSSLRI